MLRLYGTPGPLGTGAPDSRRTWEPGAPCVTLMTQAQRFLRGHRVDCIGSPGLTPHTVQTVPERLDRVIIATSHGDIVLPWASRDALLAQIEHLSGAHGIGNAFAAVGASRPVTLTTAQVRLLVVAIDLWCGKVTEGGLPGGVWDLRNALVDDLNEDGR